MTTITITICRACGLRDGDHKADCLLIDRLIEAEARARLQATYGPLGYEAQLGHRVLVGPDPDGQGGSFDVVMGDQVRIVSTNQVGKLVRRRIGSPDDRVVVLVDGEAVEAQGYEVVPWEGG